jgi:hypothetical protein
MNIRATGASKARFGDRKGRGRREDGRAVPVLAGEVRDMPDQRACVGRASQLAGLSR